MNEKQLRADVAKGLKLDDVPDALWKYLEGREHVKEVLDGFTEVADLINEAKTQRRLSQQLANRKAPPGRKPRTSHIPKLQDAELARAQSLSECLGHFVATIPRVRRVRAKLLDSTTLSSAQAAELLSSPAIRTLSYEEFKDLDIPLIGHTARGGTMQLEAAGQVWVATLNISWAGQSYDGVFRWDTADDTRESRMQEYSIPACGTEYVWPSSVLGELYDCSRWLEQRFPWKLNDALWYVLTGAFPDVSPLGLRVHKMEHGDLHRAQITISVDPWVSADTVRNAYRAVQSMVLAGKDNRRLEEKSLALTPFIASQRAGHEKRPTWRHLMATWNQRYPGWAYNDVSNFARDADRAEKNLRFPAYQVPWRPQMSPEIAWKANSIDEDFEQRIKTLQAKKVSTESIAKIMGVSPSTLDHFIRARNLA